MADFNSSLPVRTENNGDVVAKIADATVPSQQLTVESDGSINTNSVVTATDLDIRDLDSAQDSVEVLQATHDNLNANANIQVGNADVANGNPVPVSDAGGSLTVDANNLDIRDLVFATDKADVSGSTVALDAGTLAALESITVQNGAGAAAVNIQDGGNSITVDANNLDIRDLTSVSDSVSVLQATHDNLNGNANIQVNNTDVSSSNPVPVSIVDSSPGTAINDYNTQAALAAGASNTHTYTSIGNFYLNHIWASGSGKIKIVVSVNSVVKFVGFNSTANPNIEIDIPNPILATVGQTVTIARTNLEVLFAQDVYSTISGYNG